MTLTVTFDLRFENFNSAHSFLTNRHMAFIFGMCILYDDLSDGSINFDHVTLTVTFDSHYNIYSAHNFLTTRNRALIFGMCIPYDKNFPAVL